MFFSLWLMLLSFQATSAPVSFIEMVKHDPTALVDLLDTADPQALDNIIVILEGLITDNTKKVDQLKNNLKEANEALVAGKLDESEQTGKCATLKAVLDTKNEEESTAQGVVKEAKATQLARETNLKNELVILKAVLGNITSLQADSEQNSRRLLAFDSVDIVSSIKEDPHSFIESLINANPAKLELVINLIGELIASAEKDLNKIVQDVTDAGEALKEAIKAAKEALTEFGTCGKKLGEKTATVSELQGKADAAKTALDNLGAQFLHENGVLNKIITELNNLKP